MTRAEVIDFVRGWRETDEPWETYRKGKSKLLLDVWQSAVVDAPRMINWEEAEKIMVDEIMINRTKLGKALK